MSSARRRVPVQPNEHDDRETTFHRRRRLEEAHLARVRRDHAIAQSTRKYRFGWKHGKTMAYRDKYGVEVAGYFSLKEMHNHRVRFFPRNCRPRDVSAPAIAYTCAGHARPMCYRPFGMLPPHIMNALESHYLQVTKGLMVPEADLYNNIDQPTEPNFPSVIDPASFQKLIQTACETSLKLKEQNEYLRSGPKGMPRFLTHPRPYKNQILTHGEMIGSFVMYGTGKNVRSVCMKTRQVFYAHVLPLWKIEKIIEVMQRLQIPDDKMYHSPDDRRLSELCVSKRTEIIKADDRYILFTPSESNTVHSFAFERMDKITERECMEIFKKMVELVKFCHSRGVLMRNTKPRNYYLTIVNGEFVVRPSFLVDFCVEADNTDAMYARQSVCLPFLAPEMLTANPVPMHNRASEMWSLGINLFILLTGKYPFFAKTERLLFRAIKRKQQVWPINYISPRTKAIVEGLLIKIPAFRTTLDELCLELEYTFPDIRCRSNMLLRYQDMRVKKRLLSMYWNSYQNRLLPHNIRPIREELDILLQDLPLAREMSEADTRLIHDQVRHNIRENLTDIHMGIINLRLDQINDLVQKRDEEDCRRLNCEPDPVTLTIDDISLELLLPRSIYPTSQYYHPSQNDVDHLVYKLLQETGNLEWPLCLYNGIETVFPAPKFRGRDISTI
ncbi:unnamed protein product [Caenorhabditis sp. 36 PRJEB53466]|nr:unnamed protein product [Caenorhabditis sp. 36 PRJEB53466]